MSSKTGLKINPFTFPSETSLLIITLFFISLTCLWVTAQLSEFMLLNIIFIFTTGIDLTVFRILNCFAIALFYVFMATTAMFYLLKPRYTMKREKLKRMNDVLPEIDAWIQGIAVSMDVRKKFTILYSEAEAAESYTFGNYFKNYLVISKGFHKAFRDRESEYKAIVCHELSHIYNRDVSRAELVISFLYTFDVFLIFNLSIFFAGLILKALIYQDIKDVQSSFSDYLLNFAMLIVFAIAIHYIVASLLRWRELYADARAVRVLHDKQPLMNALNLLEAMVITSTKKLAFVSSSANLFAIKYHPDNNVRKQYLKHPEKFFNINFFLPLISGILAGVVFYNMSSSNLLLLTVLSAYPKARIVLNILLSSAGFIIFTGIILANYAPSLFSSKKSNKSLIYPVLISLCFFVGLEFDKILQYPFMFTLRWEFVQIAVIDVIESLNLSTALLLFLLSARYIIVKLQNCYGVRLISNWPAISFIALPYLILVIPTLIIYNYLFLATLNNIISTAIMFAGSIILFVILCIFFGTGKAFRYCPECKSLMSEPYTVNLTCKTCGHVISSIGSPGAGSGISNALTVVPENERTGAIPEISKIRLMAILKPIVMFFPGCLVGVVVALIVMCAVLAESAFIVYLPDDPSTIALGPASSANASLDVSSFAMYRGGPQHTGVFDESICSEGIDGPPALKWKTLTGGYVRSSPVLYADRVYVGSYDDALYCFSADTGEVLWKFKTGGDISSSPAVVAGRVYIGSRDGYLYCIDAYTGSEIWKYQACTSITGDPAVSDSRVYFCNDLTYDKGYIYCLNAESGVEIWTHLMGDGVICSPAVAGNTVYVGDKDGYLHALDANDGQEKWKFATETTEDYISSSPAVVDGIIYFGSSDYYVYALNAETGEGIWKYKTGHVVSSSPAVANGVIYIWSHDNNLYALNASTGYEIWTFQANGMMTSSPAVIGQLVYFGSYDQGVFCIDAATGEVSWSLPSDEPIYSSFAIGDGVLYIGNDNGYLYALEEPYLLIPEERPAINASYPPMQPGKTTGSVAGMVTQLDINVETTSPYNTSLGAPYAYVAIVNASNSSVKYAESYANATGFFSFDMVNSTNSGYLYRIYADHSVMGAGYSRTFSVQSGEQTLQDVYLIMY